MKRFSRVGIGMSCMVILLLGRAIFLGLEKKDSDSFVIHIVNPHEETLKFYWKDRDGNRFQTIENLKKSIESQGKKLTFAMNGGIYDPEFEPLGLLIQEQKETMPLNQESGDGNFYLQPNGVFYLDQTQTPFLVPTSDFIQGIPLSEALQSGPMLLIDGKINPAFQKGSENVYVRNGVGILPDQTILFAMSKKEINFYDFAHYFKEQGCQNALYLDGFVSRTYLPEKKWEQTDGNLSVIIGVVE